MADVYKVGGFLDAADCGAFHAMMGEIASNDPERIAHAEEDALTALSSIGSMFNVVAAYLYIRAQHPKDGLYASDYDVADAVYSLSDLTACVHSSLNEAHCARAYLQGTAREVPANRSKEG